MKFIFYTLLLFFVYCETKKPQEQDKQDYIYIQNWGKIKIKNSDTIVARLIDSAALANLNLSRWPEKQFIYHYEGKNKNEWKHHNYGEFYVDRTHHHITRITTYTCLDDITIEQISKLSHLENLTIKGIDNIKGVDNIKNKMWKLWNDNLSKCFKNVKKITICNIEFPKKKIIIDKNYLNVEELYISGYDLEEIVFDVPFYFTLKKIGFSNNSGGKVRLINPPMITYIENYSICVDF